MNRVSASAATESELLSLLYELLDAHTDTIEIGAGLAEELRWRVHLDYLRALQRKTREMVAHWYSRSDLIGPR
jgi:hypothetical protein